MKLDFLCPNIPGHLNPMTALARHLQARNHEVVFLYSTTVAGLPCVPAPERGHFNESTPEMSELKGGDASSLALRALMAEMEAILETLPATPSIPRRTPKLALDELSSDRRPDRQYLKEPSHHSERARAAR
jgi:hypothetical protein